eukprot:12366638-Karenia_brevis.AAC.1
MLARLSLSSRSVVGSPCSGILKFPKSGRKVGCRPVSALYGEAPLQNENALMTKNASARSVLN